MKQIVKKAFHEGHDAFDQDLGALANPYEPDTDEHFSWDWGYDYALEGSL